MLPGGCDAAPDDYGSARAYLIPFGIYVILFVFCLVVIYALSCREARLVEKLRQEDAERHKMMIDVHGSPMPLAEGLESLLNSDASLSDVDLDYDRFGSIRATMKPSEAASALVVGAPRQAVHGITAELLGPNSPDGP